MLPVKPEFKSDLDVDPVQNRDAGDGTDREKERERRRERSREKERGRDDDDREERKRRKRKSRSRERSPRSRSRSRERRKRSHGERHRSKSRDRDHKPKRVYKYWDVPPQGYEHMAPKEYKELQSTGQIPRATIQSSVPVVGPSVTCQSRRIYVGNIPFGCNEEAMRDFFNQQDDNTPFLERLGKLSEKRMRETSHVKLPNSDDFYFQAEKERYFKNMYKLIITARQVIQSLEVQIQQLNTKLRSQNAVSCPSCSHKFNTGQNRYLPKYLKVLRSTNRVELQFRDILHLKEWLLLNNLDCDAENVPTYFEKENAKPSTLAGVNSTFAEFHK